MPNIGHRTVGQDPSAPNVRDPQQKGDEIERSRGQDDRGKQKEPIADEAEKSSNVQNADDEGANG